MDRRSAEVLSIPGVTGVFISELADNSPCILILVKERSDKVMRQIPDSLDGYPVRVEISDEFQPM